MCVCVVCIVGLQLFWNVQNYQHTVKAFDHDVNEALETAVSQEQDIRREEITGQFKKWLSDTALITITADHLSRDSSTVFHFRESHGAGRPVSMGFVEFKERLNHITPEARMFFINTFSEHVVKKDLKAGIVYYYTQLLGDSLEKTYSLSHTQPSRLDSLLRIALSQKGIHESFSLNPKPVKGEFLTRPVKTNLRDFGPQAPVYAGFTHPQTYYVKTMKWVILTSLLLIIISIWCFVYTARILLSQEKLNRLKDDFMHNVTHELATPVTSIQVTAEALQTFSHSPERQSEYLDIIRGQAGKLECLIDQILGAAGGSTAGTPEPVSLSALMKQTLTDIQPLMDQKKATLEFNNSEIMVSGDAARLGIAFKNILDNALKYSEAPAHIRIDITVQPTGAEVRVADNGMGIPTEYKSPIFDRFFRVPQGNRHNVKGYGLGLSQVAQIVKEHQGKVSVIDNVGQGSVFIIQLPL